MRLGLRLSWRVTVHGAQHVPRSGPVILAANHIGMLDGPALLALTRRLTFALVKREAFTGAVGRFLAYIGQISLNRREVDPQAIRRAIQVLRAGKVLAVFPEGRPRWRRSRLGQARCCLPGHGVGCAYCPGGHSRHSRTWSKQEPAAPAAGIDSSGLRRAIRRPANSVAAPQGSSCGVDRRSSGSAWPIT